LLVKREAHVECGQAVAFEVSRPSVFRAGTPVRSEPAHHVPVRNKAFVPRGDQRKETGLLSWHAACASLREKRQGRDRANDGA